MSVESIKVHTREHEAFFNEVHSFEFWPQSVNGYLRDRPHGVSPDTPIPNLDEQESEALVVALSTDCVGEVAALEEASDMIGFAPSQYAGHGLSTCKARLLKFIETKDWEVLC
ncbi:MAG: hypothetical protein IH881_19390 [Myxococcales bacterium]|nr:hypothetical protein [Myxococcales bacterium]